MEQNTVTLVVAGLGIAGTFGSGVMAQWLAGRFQRKQWLRDRKVDEYREVLSAITKTYMVYVKSQAPNLPMTYHDEMTASLTESMQMIVDRLLVARAMTKLRIAARWSKATGEFDHQGDVDLFATRYRSIVDDIIESASSVSDESDLFDDLLKVIRENIPPANGL